MVSAHAPTIDSNCKQRCGQTCQASVITKTNGSTNGTVKDFELIKDRLQVCLAPALSALDRLDIPGRKKGNRWRSQTELHDIEPVGPVAEGRNTRNFFPLAKPLRSSASNFIKCGAGPAPRRAPTSAIAPAAWRYSPRFRRASPKN